MLITNNNFRHANGLYLWTFHNFVLINFQLCTRISEISTCKTNFHYNYDLNIHTQLEVCSSFCWFPAISTLSIDYIILRVCKFKIWILSYINFLLYCFAAFWEMLAKKTLKLYVNFSSLCVYTSVNVSFYHQFALFSALPEIYISRTNSKKIQKK